MRDSRHQNGSRRKVTAISGFSLPAHIPEVDRFRGFKYIAMPAEIYADQPLRLVSFTAESPLASRNLAAPKSAPTVSSKNALV
jgi:hypothetical protein